MNRNFLRSMYETKNVKRSIKSYGQDAGFSTVPVSIKSGRASRNVRGLPFSAKSGIGLYKSACSSVSNKIGKKKKTWVDDFEHFAQLHNVSWSHVSEPSSSLDKMIELYLKAIRAEYQEINVTSTHELNKKLDLVKEQWIQQHGSLPETSKNKRKVEKQQGRKATALESEEKLDQQELSVNSEAITENEVCQQDMAKDDEKDRKKMQKEYESVLRQVEENHFPTVYAKPGTSNFDYLCNSIRLMTAKRSICFSLDVEAYEFDNNIVTEIGIAIYDPRENISSLVPMTRNYHLIISEALPLRNKKWVCDFKDCYLLGESLVMNLHECVEFVQSLINYYMKPQTKEDRSWSRAFVGHNLQGDLRWLRKMGVKIPAEESMDHTLQKFKLKSEPDTEEPIFILDTEKLYRFCYGSKGSNLGRLLRLFRIPHSFLHNAGNDAHYTLKLLMHMCDVNFRKQARMDNLTEMSRKINQWIEREKEEPKILPMSYAVSVVEATKKRTPKSENGHRRKQPKDLVPQTEFGGSQYFDSAFEAFKSTLEL